MGAIPLDGAAQWFRSAVAHSERCGALLQLAPVKARGGMFAQLVVTTSRVGRQGG